MIKINIPASKAMNGEIAPNRIVTAPPLVCANAEPVVLRSKTMNRARSLSVTAVPPSAPKITRWRWRFMSCRSRSVANRVKERLNGSKLRGKTLLKLLIRFSKQQDYIAVLRQLDGNSMRQREDIAVQQGVHVVPV